jgi:DnaK suppressor protein
MAAVSFGKRIGDGTTEAVERLNKVGAANAIAATLADVERAIAKLADGTYAQCDHCGEAISPERLEAIPWASLCILCARAR